MEAEVCQQCRKNTAFVFLNYETPSQTRRLALCAACAETLHNGLPEKVMERLAFPSVAPPRLFLAGRVEHLSASFVILRIDESSHYPAGASIRIHKKYLSSKLRYVGAKVGFSFAAEDMEKVIAIG